MALGCERSERRRLRLRRRPGRLTTHNLPYNSLSTVRGQTGILVHVHPVLPWNLKSQQPQLPRSEPDGQPTESSHLGPDLGAPVVAFIGLLRARGGLELQGSLLGLHLLGCVYLGAFTWARSGQGGYRRDRRAGDRPWAPARLSFRGWRDSTCSARADRPGGSARA